MSAWASGLDLIVSAIGGGVFTGAGSAAITAIRHRRLDTATEAQIVSGISRDLAADLREDNVGLRTEVRNLHSHVDKLEAKIDALAEVLVRAVHRLEEHGDDTTEYRAILKRAK